MTPAPRTIRVVLADDHALVRAGIRALLGAASGIDVVAEATDGPELIAMVGKHQPDVVLLDITMPGMNGIQVIGQLQSDHERIRVIVLTMHDNEEYVRAALRAGASGYLLKDATPLELELAVAAVARGGSYLSPMVSRHVVTDYVRRAQDDGPWDGLSARQREVLQLIAEGNTNQGIARRLSLSVKTVESHRGELMSRLDIHDVAGLVRYAIRTGLIASDR